MKKLIVILMLLVTTPVFGGVDFDGIDDVISVPDSDGIDLSGTALTISMWVRQDSDQGGFPVPLHKESGDVPRGGYIIFLDTTEHPNIRIRDSASGTSTATSSLALTVGAWHNVIGWYDGTDIKIYIDGVEKGTTAATRTVGATNVNLGIGIDVAGGGTFFDGVINELAMWNVDITASEIDLLASAKGKRMACQVSPSNLIDSWSMDECADGVSCDAVIFNSSCGSAGDVGTGGDGDNNTGLAGTAEEVLTYP
jgi:hypothetical protein